MNPAYMIRQMNEEFSGATGVPGRITSLKPLRPENAPDEWERKALEDFESGVKEAAQFTEIDGEPYLRLLRPMAVTEKCLKCHGHQGYKVGDIRGGTGVSLNMTPLLAAGRKHNTSAILGHVFLWLVGLLGLGLGTRRLSTEAGDRILAENMLRKSEALLTETSRMAKVGGWELDAETFEVSWTEETYHIHEVPLDHKPPLEEAINFYHPDDRSKLETAVQKALEHGEPYDMELRLITAAGRHLWIHTICKPITVNGKTVKLIGPFQDITERRKTEESLRESEERYRAIAEDMPVMICRSLPGGEITYVNDAYCRYFAKTSEELVGTSSLSLILEEDRERVAGNISALTVESPTQSHEYQVVAPDGSIRWHRWTKRALFDAGGNAVAYQDIGEDITDHKRAEEALVESEARFRTITEASVDYIILLDVDLRVQYINRVEPGLSIDEVIGTPLYEFVAEKDRTRIEELLRETLETGVSARYDTEYPRPDGTLVHFESVVAQLNTGEKVAGLVLSSRDITERERAEEALAEREEQYRAVVENSSDYFMRYDKNFRHIYANRAALEVTGLPRDEYIGKTHREMGFAENLCKLWEERIQKVFDTGKQETVEFEVELAEGLMYHELQLNPEFSADGNVNSVIGISRDLTERREGEEALKHSEARYRLLSGNLDREVKKKVVELQQAEKMATIGMVVSSVAHEVRNPLHNIRMGVDALQREIGDDRDNLEILDEINYGVDILNNIIEELLEYSKPLNLQRSHVPLDATINQAVKMLSHKLDNITVHMELDKEDREIFVDPVKLGEVFENLISNAADAMPSGGAIRIGSDLTRIDKSDFLRISISDTGSGIDEEKLGRIFEPFFTTKAKGTGLGLSVCMRILDAHDGTLNVTSNINQGTSVEIILPLKEA